MAPLLTAVRLVCGANALVATLSHVAYSMDGYLLDDGSLWTLEEASVRGFVRLLDRLLKHEWPGFNPQYRLQRLRVAMTKDYDVSVLQWWLKNYMPAQTEFSMSDIIGLAIENAHLQVLQGLLEAEQGRLPTIAPKRCSSPEIAYWLFEHERHLEVVIVVKADHSSEYIKWCMAVEDDDDCSFTIEWPRSLDMLKHGHLEFLQGLRGYQPETNALEIALRYGHLSVAKWLRQSHPKDYILDLIQSSYHWEKLDLEVAQWIVNEFEWTDDEQWRVGCLRTLSAAATAQGKLDGLEFLVEVATPTSQPVSIDTGHDSTLDPECFGVAAANGRLAVVQWLHGRQ